MSVYNFTTAVESISKSSPKKKLVFTQKLRNEKNVLKILHGQQWAR